MEACTSLGNLDLAAVFAALPAAAAVVEADAPRFTVVAASDAFLAVVQRARDAVVGRPLPEVLANRGDPPISGLSDVRASLAAAVQTGVMQRMARQRYNRPRPDGGLEARYWDAVHIPVPGPNGAVRYVLHELVDVTAEVHDEAAAARAERRAERIIAPMGDAHCVLDRELCIQSVNAATERVLGVPRAALLGRSHWEVFPASEDAPVGGAFRGVVAERVEQHLTHHYKGEGYDLHLEVDAYPTDEGGLALFWRDVTERVRTEEALRASEEKYRALFNEMDEAYAVVEVMADAEGRWMDFRFLEVNPAFMRHTGMPYPVGRTAIDLVGFPNPRWAELYGRAAETGESIRLEEPELTLGRVFDLNIFRLGGQGSRRVAVLFTDITERKRAEEALRRSEARQAYLVRLGDALRPLASAAELQQAAAKILGEQLRANRAFYAEVEGESWLVANAYERGVEPQARGRHALAQFGEWVVDTFRAGEPLVIRDLHADARFDPSQRAAHAACQILGAVAVPLVKAGTLVAVLVVHTAAARDWNEHEIALVEETAERTWTAVDRARSEAARRASDARYRTLFESIDEGFVVAEVLYDTEGRPIDALYLEGNPAASRLTGVPDFSQRRSSDAAPGAEPYWPEIYDRVGRTGVAERLERYTAPLARWYDFHVSRVADEASDGPQRIAVVFQDITLRKRAEHVLRESEERLRRALSIPTVGVMFFRLDGSTLEANAALARMTGYTLAELRGLEHWSALTPPEFMEVTARATDELAALGETAPYEKQWRRKDGSLMWGLFAPTRLAGSGRDSECVEFVIDITRTKEAEVALRESERRLAQELTAARTLQWVSTELISEAEPRALYAKLVDAAIGLMRADAGSIQILERDGSLRLLASRRLDPESELRWQRVGVETATSCAVALNRKERIIVPDVEACDFMAGTPDLDAYRRSCVRAVQSTPLVARDGRAVGMLSTHWHHTRASSANEFALFDVLAREAADFLDRMQVQTALRERAEWVKGQGNALMAAVNGAPLETSLGALVQTATEALGTGVLAAFYLAGSDGTSLHHVVGMPDEYASAVDGFEIGSESLASGQATHRGEPVLTVDVQTDLRWERWRRLPEHWGYRGCWSFPIHSTSGTLVGMLALYGRHSGEASARELELASLLTNTAAIIISRHRESQVRQQAEEALRASVAEREALLRELHHRVKNNLQVITSLLEMQARHVNAPPALPSLLEARNRVSAIGTIHELLYQSGSLSRVDLLSYAKRLLPHVVSLYEKSGTVGISVLGDQVTVDLARAVPIGLLLNELISNVCKHAFPTNAAGELTVALKEDEERMHLRVTDTGVGLPAGFSVRDSKTLGVQLVQMLAKQLGGTIEFRSATGTTVDAYLPR